MMVMVMNRVKVRSRMGLMVQVLLLLLASLLLPAASALQPLNCSAPIEPKASSNKYDFSEFINLNVNAIAIDTTTYAASQIIQQTWINVCGPLAKRDNVPDDEQCATGARMCQTVSVRHNSTNLFVDKIPISPNGEYADIFMNEEKNVIIEFVGGRYMDMGTRAQIKFVCDQNAITPNVSSSIYRPNKDTFLYITWKTRVVCEGYKRDGNAPAPPPPSPPSGDNGNNNNNNGGGGESSGMSGFGVFMLVVFISLVAYFVIGSAYNYSVLRLRGSEILPHHDFWFGLWDNIVDGIGWLYEKISGRQRHYSSLVLE